MYTNIVCEFSIANTIHRRMLNDYAFQFPMAAKAIGFRDAYLFDIQWRKAQTGFKSLDILNANALWNSAVASATISKVNSVLASVQATTAPAVTANQRSRSALTAPAKLSPFDRRANPSSLAREATAAGKSNYCMNWNDKTCTGCKRLHLCFVCNSPDHPRRLCPNRSSDKSESQTGSAGTLASSNQSNAASANAGQPSVAAAKPSGNGRGSFGTSRTQ